MLCMCLNILLNWLLEGEVSSHYLTKAPKLIAVEIITVEYLVASQLAIEIRLENTITLQKPLLGSALYVTFNSASNARNFKTWRIQNVQDKNMQPNVNVFLPLYVCDCSCKVCKEWACADPPGPRKNAAHPGGCEERDECDQRSGRLPNKIETSGSSGSAVLWGDLLVHIFSSPSPDSHLQMLKI